MSAGSAPGNDTSYRAGRQSAAFGKSRYSEIEDQYREIGGNDTEETFEIKFSIGNRLPLCHAAEELSPDQVAAENEEEVYAGPAEAADGVHLRRMTEYTVMVNEYENDGQGTKVVEACEAFAGRGGVHDTYYLIFCFGMLGGYFKMIQPVIFG